MAANNPMIPTPTLPGAGYYENLYRGRGLSELAILRQQMRLGGLNVGERVVDIGGGVTIKAVICFNDERVYVRVTPAASNQEAVWKEVPLRGVVFSTSGGPVLLNADTAIIAADPNYSDSLVGPPRVASKAYWGVVTAIGSDGSFDIDPLYSPTEIITLSGGLYWYDFDKMPACLAQLGGVFDVIARTQNLYGVYHAYVDDVVAPSMPAAPSVDDLVVTSGFDSVSAAPDIPTVLVWRKAFRWNSVTIPVAGVRVVAASRCIIDGNSCLVAAVQPVSNFYSYAVSSWGLPESPAQQLVRDNGTYPIYLICYDETAKMWTQLSGPMIVSRPFALDLDLAALGIPYPAVSLTSDQKLLLGEHGAVFPYLWYYYYSFAYISWQLECAVSPDGLTFGFTWKGGVRSNASKADTWAFYQPYKSIDDLLSNTVAYNKFYYLNTGFSDINAVGGQYEQFKVAIISKSAYSVEYDRATVTDCFDSVVEGAAVTIAGKNCRTAHRQFAIGFAPTGTGLETLYCREYYYHADPPETVVQDDPRQVSTAHIHGVAVTLRRTPHDEAQELGTVTEYPNLPLDQDEVVLWSAEYSGAQVGDLAKNYSLPDRIRVCAPSLYLIDGGMPRLFSADLLLDSNFLASKVPSYITTYNRPILLSADYRITFFGQDAYTSSATSRTPISGAALLTPETTTSAAVYVAQLAGDYSIRPHYRPSMLMVLQTEYPSVLWDARFDPLLRCPPWWPPPFADLSMTKLYNDYWSYWLDTGVSPDAQHRRWFASSVAFDMTMLGGGGVQYASDQYTGGMTIVDTLLTTPMDR